MAFAAGTFSPSGFKAENDLSTKQFYLVELGAAADEIDVCDGAGDIAIGVLQNKPTAGQAAEVAMGGFCKAIASGAITKGAAVGTDGSGKLVTKSSNNDWCIGRARDAATADGDIITLWICPFYLGA
jgi:hypothetical protein